MWFARAQTLEPLSAASQGMYWQEVGSAAEESGLELNTLVWGGASQAVIKQLCPIPFPLLI